MFTFCFVMRYPLNLVLEGMLFIVRTSGTKTKIRQFSGALRGGSHSRVNSCGLEERSRNILSESST